MRKKITKNRKKIIDKVLNKKYSLKETLSIIKKIGFAKFDESIDLSINIHLDKKNHQNQNIKGILKLPHSIGKKNCILALINNEKVESKLKSENVDVKYIGLSFIEKIKSGWWDNHINIVITEPSIMRKINPIAKILGSKRLMPSLKTETISNNPVQCIKEIKNGKIIFQSDRYGIIHSSIGKKSFSNDFLYDNIKFFIKGILKKRPITFREDSYIKSIYISTTMSNSILLETKFLF